MWTAWFPHHFLQQQGCEMVAEGREMSSHWSRPSTTLHTLVFCSIAHTQTSPPITTLTPTISFIPPHTLPSFSLSVVCFPACAVTPYSCKYSDSQSPPSLFFQVASGCWVSVKVNSPPPPPICSKFVIFPWSPRPTWPRCFAGRLLRTWCSAVASCRDPWHRPTQRRVGAITVVVLSPFCGCCTSLLLPLVGRHRNLWCWDPWLMQFWGKEAHHVGSRYANTWL